jgi:DNA/RNA endonuclease G (NUC1)
MRLSLRRNALTLLGSVLLLSCTDNPLGPRTVPTSSLRDVTSGPPSVRFSEIHYDNVGTDTGEGIEISGPADTDVTNWSIVLYNGANGAVYSTKTLSGKIPATCGARGVIVTTYPQDGIQNGSPDGMALVDNHGVVIEFLSYEGTFKAVGGAADGMSSVDIVAIENADAVGQSLGRNGDGTWNGPAANTFGSCNDNGTVVTGPLAKIVLTPSSATLVNGEKQQLAAAGADANNNPVATTFTWSSDKTDIATVDANGLVTSKSPGDAIISAASGTISGTATIHVSAASAAQIVIDELMADPLHAAGGASFGEWFEVYNAGTTPIDMQGWTIASLGQPSAIIGTSLIVPARGYAVLGRGADPTQNGGISIDYNYFTGTSSTTIFLDATDYLVLRDAAGARVDSVRWTNSATFVKGVTRALKDATLDNSNVDGTNWGYSTTSFGDGDLGTPHLANGTLNTNPPPVPNTLSFTGRLSSDPALPIGFEDQLFATEKDGTGNTVTTEFTWKAETPTLASIDANGVMHALAPGNAIFRATASDGTTSTTTLPMAVATASTTAHYGNNTEFGTPVDNDASDDFIITRPEYTTSYNFKRGTPNWVAYDLDASQFGSNVDRCDCFTFDPALPASFTHYTTADYTGAGAAAGYGIDRGHLARSFDRTSGTLDNAYTYLFSNIVPQASDLNQGPWALLENALGDFATKDNKEVYIIAGVAGSKGTVKSEGKITIPASTWKVAVIMPRDKGLADVHDYRDIQVIAVNMPNEPGVRNVPWQTYQTTVRAIEQLTGYNLLSALPDNIENAVETNTQPPIASVNGPFTSNEGSSVSMSAANSIDPNGSIVSYSWTFGDGASATGSTTTHTYAQDGDYKVRFIAVDNDGLADTLFTTAHVANVAPTIAAFAGDTLLPGETYTTASTFTDPGADPWTASVNYGDGSGTMALALNAKAFSLSHTYANAGTFTVTVGVTDDHVTSTSTATVLVLSASQGVESAMDLVSAMASDGRLSGGNANAISSKLDAALKQLNAGKTTPAANQLGAALNQLDAMVRSGQVPASVMQPLHTLVDRLIASIGK